jgi:hypothetical protein
VGGEEPLRLAGRFELLHLPLSSARRLVRVFRSVVEPLVLAMLDARHHLSSGRAVAGKLVGDHLSRRRWTRTSSTIPVWSTARHNQCFTPAILSTTMTRGARICFFNSLRNNRLAAFLFATFQSSLPIALYILGCAIIGIIATALLTDYTNKDISAEYERV